MSEALQDRADAEMNDHHGVPRSFLGSNDRQTNLTLVPMNEHNAFHDMAGHRPPASFLRRALLSSVNWHDQEEKMLPAGLYRDMLPLLTPRDWRDLYQPGAIRQDTEQHTGNGHTKAAVHVHLHLWEEQELVAQGIGALGISKYLKKDVRDFMNDAMLFFHTDNPVRMMRSYLTDKNHEGERKWAKPLRHDLHSGLCDMLKQARLERMTLESRKSLIRVLDAHHDQLEDRSSSWKPALAQSIDAIAEYGHLRMEQMLKRRRR